MGLAALTATLLVWGAARNRLVRGKLKLSIFLLAGYTALHVVLLLQPELAGGGPDLSTPTPADLRNGIRPFERLAITAAIINLLVVGLLNPLRKDRVRDGFPSIVQDAIVIGLLLIVATFVFKEQLLTTSAVGAVVVGFALQDTLGNAFAGLAIQSERPFQVGHWIAVGQFEGRVAEVTWRATKLRTRSGNLVVVPNNVIAKEAITNYSEPADPSRHEVEVGVSYQASPQVVKEAIREALSQAASVLRSPPPDVLLVGFDASSMNYRARFWIRDHEHDDEARDEVRVAIHYAFARHGIEIPYPVQVEYSREMVVADPAVLQRQREQALADVDLFRTLTDRQRTAIAAATTTRTYGDGETIIREGEPGDSMYIVCSGKVSVRLGAIRREVASIEEGGYFGEMSLLTGEPRTATVVACGETVVLQLTAEQFRTLGIESPQAVEQIGLAASARRRELDQVAAARGALVADAPTSFIAKMKKFLHLR
jgi:small-conductance mechanosensitive channel